MIRLGPIRMPVQYFWLLLFLWTPVWLWRRRGDGRVEASKGQFLAPEKGALTPGAAQEWHGLGRTGHRDSGTPKEDASCWSG